MSKIAKKPILIPDGAEVNLEAKSLKVSGPLGELQINLPAGIEPEIAENKVFLRRASDERQLRALHGTYARLVQNAFTGVAKGFEKVLEIVGTGYRGQMEGETLVLSLGYSHPVKFSSPQGVKLSVQENKIRVFGIDKEKVGIVAQKIRRFKKPDSYKGKGIRFLGEKLRLKPGKAVAKAGVAAGK